MLALDVRHLICSVCALVAMGCVGGSGVASAETDSASATVVADSTELIADPYLADRLAIEQWCAGEAVDSLVVVDYGVERCFTSCALPDSVFALLDGVSYHDSSPVGRADLRYLRLLHYDAEGNIRLGEMVCHRRVAADVLGVFRDLYDARYPIQRVLLVDNYGGDDEASMADNNSSCYNCRSMQGSQRLSLHAQGLAVDINPLYNPYVKTVKCGVVIAPAQAADYADRTPRHPYMIRPGDACCRAFAAHGFAWGGYWRRSVKDYQHFQKKP